MKNALTIDLEDWYHGLTRTMVVPERWSALASRANESTAILLDLLAEADVRVTFFVLGDLARRFPRLIARVAQAGHELASHGCSHRPIHRLTPTEFKLDLDASREMIQQAAGIHVSGFRAPQFSIDQRCLWAFQVLAECGYQFDSSVFPARGWLYGYPGAPRGPYRPLANAQLVEYPLATLRLGGLTLPAAGGVYTRFLPYGLIRRAIRRLNAQGLPAVFHLHPWELDVLQPRIPVNPREYLSHYGMRGSLIAKLRRLCKDFRFVPLGNFHQDWIEIH